MNVTLLRIEFSDTETYGILIVDGRKFCDTIELPWKNNEQHVSCIPAGPYKCKRYTSPKFGSVFKILNVTGRDDIILGHVGNVPQQDSTGCVLFGDKPTMLNGKRAVANSARTMAAWQALTDGVDELHLQIIGIWRL